MYPVRKFNVAEAAYSTNLRLKMQEAEGMVRRIAPSRERSLALTKDAVQLFQRCIRNVMNSLLRETCKNGVNQFVQATSDS